MDKLQFSTQLLQNESSLKMLARHLTKNAQDAADLHQDTLCKALEYHDNYIAGTNLYAWLYVIMRNIFINMYRRKKRSLKLFRVVADNAIIDNSVDLSYQLELDSKRILFQIDKIPNHFKMPFVLYLEGYKYAEIAVLLGEPIGTIKSRIFFARKLLKSTVETD